MTSEAQYIEPGDLLIAYGKVLRVELLDSTVAIDYLRPDGSEDTVCFGSGRVLAIERAV